MQEVCGSCAGRKRLVRLSFDGNGEGEARIVLVRCETGKHDMWTKVDAVMLLVVVATWVDRAVWFDHGEHQLENRSAQESS